MLMQRQTVLFGVQNRFSEAEFNRLFLDTYAQICAAAFRIVGDPDEAEELAAEAFWKLWQNPPSVLENLPGWLYRVVINLSYNRIRSAQRRLHHEELGGRAEVTGALAPNPHEAVERKQEIERVQSVLRSLSEREVQVLTLRAMGLSYKEMAAVMDVAPGNIGTWVARAEQKFESRYTMGERNAPRR
jgi:RNA polymerase sigma-70 factor (ECF subfamily)